jgi:beta-xylosidase
MEAWGTFMRDFAIALIERYGLATVKSWPFEVWN